ncbi:FhaA domain-containing protein [Modestobacter sp. SSW1-42]|uniref:FhaA domain-containing protein n=1 Tax=Modestobacter sp. SSW1-42 TaxID=596372 RepID=UPI0039862C29
MGVLQRFERRLEGMVGLAFARVFKGKVHPAEIAHALQREADEQRSVMGGGRVLAPNVFVVTLGPTDHDHLGEWSEQLAAELADMVREHMEGEGYETFGDVEVRLERDESLRTGVFEVASHVGDDGHRGAPAAPPPPPGLPPLPPLRGGAPVAAPPPVAGHPADQVTHLLVVDGPGTKHVLEPGSNVLGRGTEADIRLPDTGVSRKHADVQLTDGAVAVQDLGSTNGTLVNGRRVGFQELFDGDVIRVGHSVLVYRQDGA